MNVALPILIAYLLGGIPFGLLIPRLFGVADIRQHGSGNIGATNATRVLGFRRAIWVYLGDIAKGVAAVLIARYSVGRFGVDGLSVDLFLVLCALAAVLGHLFPIYLRFKGGKGVNTALGTMLALLPIEALIAFGVFAVVVLTTRYVSLGSMLGVAAFCTVICIEKFALGRDIAMVYVGVSALLVLLIVVAHRQNIARLISGSENRVGRKKERREKVGPHV